MLEANIPFESIMRGNSVSEQQKEHTKKKNEAEEKLLSVTCQKGGRKSAEDPSGLNVIRLSVFKHKHNDKFL